MTIQCEFKINDPNGNGVYYAGQVVSGSVTLNLPQKLTVNNISIGIKGYSYWKKREKKSRYHYATYIGREEFLNETSHVVQSPPNGADIELPSGEHVYNFVGGLPRVIPPSFEATLGHIRYRIIMLVKRTWKRDIKRIVQFNVLIPLDLNRFDARIREPQIFDKNYTYFLSNDPKLELKIRLARTGFAIGETMQINVDANNRSKSDIDYISFQIVQNVLYATIRNGRRKTRTEHKVIHREETSTLSRLSHVNFDHFLTIPYMPITIYTSRVILVKYELVVTASSQWTSILIPIIIGNIPIRNENIA